MGDFSKPGQRQCLCCDEWFSLTSRAPYQNYCNDCVITEAWKS